MLNKTFIQEKIKSYMSQFKGYYNWQHSLIPKWEYELLKDLYILSPRGFLKGKIGDYSDFRQIRDNYLKMIRNKPPAPSREL